MNLNKKRILIILTILVVIVIGALNIIQSQEKKELAESESVLVYLNDEEIGKLQKSEIKKESIEFNAIFKRKVGAATEKQYKGMPLHNILELIDISPNGDYTVSIVAKDNYSIDLTKDEFLKEDNIYLVYEEDGEELDKESQPYMLVIKDDEFSTRWNKQVVKIQINE